MLTRLCQCINVKTITFRSNYTINTIKRFTTYNNNNNLDVIINSIKRFTKYNNNNNKYGTVLRWGQPNITVYRAESPGSIPRVD